MLKYYGEELENVGCGEDVTIRELAELVVGVVGFHGRIVQGPSKPDGTPRKLLDISRRRSLASLDRNNYSWR